MEVRCLSTTPIKGFALHHPDAVELTAHGATGDRDFVLADERDRLVSITKTGALLRLRAFHDAATDVLRLETVDGEPVFDARVRLGAPIAVSLFGFRDIAGHVVDGPWAKLLSELAGRPLRLVRCATPGDGSDIHPVTLLGAASVARVAERAGLDGLDARRFRMLVDIGGTAPHEEEEWDGRRLAAGEAVLRVGGPVPRCAGTTRHPVDGERDQPVVRMLLEQRGLQPNELGRGANLGVYATVERPGRLRVGDALELL